MSRGDFHEPESTLELATETLAVSGSERNGAQSGISQPATNARRLIDSDDDMDDNSDDDELLMMPSGSQAIELQIDQIFVEPERSGSMLESFPSQGHNMQPSGSNLRPQQQTNANINRATPSNGIDSPNQERLQETSKITADDNLFGEDFMAQFGQATEAEFEENKNKRPLFARRMPLLSPSNVDNLNDDQHPNQYDLGLERLSISQKHHGANNSPASGSKESAKNALVTAASTTVITSAPRLNVFNRLSAGAGASFFSQESSQIEEELLEMSARQFDASLDDLIQEDLRMQEEEADLRDILEQQYFEQEHGASASTDGNKRKHGTGVGLYEIQPNTNNDGEIALSMQTLVADEISDSTAQIANANLDPSALQAVETSKKSRLEREKTLAGTLEQGEGSKSRRIRSMETPKQDYSLPPETGSFITAKTTEGKTFYLSKKPRVNYTKSLFMEQLNQSSGDRKPLLNTPIHRMLDELDAEIRIQKQEAINRIELGDYCDYELDESATGEPKVLWVDKYRPKVYTDLMGDERVNREVLGWIKGWDKCVFGRHSKKNVSDPKNQAFKEFRKPDPLGRPDRKILLLTGPPGLGKTTMAHVIARQAGYNVIEVNASDDRTGASVKGKIDSALQNKSLQGDAKPNLLIIDEIDGVSASGGEQNFIKLLIDIATVDITPAGEKTKAESGGNRKKRSTKQPLMRPIICICNDQYAPVLRPLRTIAQIYQFKKPSVRTIVTRLQQICEMEQIPGDTRAFGMLYEMTEGDMRSCLNTLQFIKNRSRTAVSQASFSSSSFGSRIGGGTNGEGLTVDALNKATIGRKDQNKSLFSVWEEVFQAQYARKSRSALKVMEEGRDGLVKDDSNSYVSRLVTLVQNNGDYDKLMQGFYENFPAMTFHDVAMSKVVQCGEWLSFYDQLNSKISSNFEYEVGGYIPYTLINFHRFFAGSVRQKIEYPRKDYESYVAHKANESILQSMILNLPAKTYRHFQKHNFATELLSFFLRILSPYLRPVNKQLIKPDERVILQRLVDVMIHFQLTFLQEKTEEGQFLYRLEPSIEKLADFSTIGLKNVLTNRYAVRQLIAQEIEVELVRRAEALKEERKEALLNKQSSSKETSASLNSMDTSLETPPTQGKHSQKKESLERGAVDFFGRTISLSKDKGKSVSTSLNEPQTNVAIAPKTRIWYRFNEGFSNAVKAKVFISELQ